MTREIAALSATYDGRADDAELIALSRAMIAALGDRVAIPGPPPDPRIARALELIRERLGETLALPTVAAAVHLSPDRFRHLFVEETGVGFRPFLLWLRLERALGEYIAGVTLTEAAHAGGFADSASVRTE